MCRALASVVDDERLSFKLRPWTIQIDRMDEKEGLAKAGPSAAIRSHQPPILPPTLLLTSAQDPADSCASKRISPPRKRAIQVLRPLVIIPVTGAKVVRIAIALENVRRPAMTFAFTQKVAFGPEPALPRPRRNGPVRRCIPDERAARPRRAPVAARRSHRSPGHCRLTRHRNANGTQRERYCRNLISHVHGISFDRDRSANAKQQLMQTATEERTCNALAGFARAHNRPRNAPASYSTADIV